MIGVKGFQTMIYDINRKFLILVRYTSKQYIFMSITRYIFYGTIIDEHKTL